MICHVCGAEVDGHAVSKDGFQLLRCASCGLLYRRDLPRRDEVSGLYSRDYFKDDAGATGGYSDYLADESLHRALAVRRLARLERIAGSGRRLLDVGAAAGFFVSEAINRGWAARGVDISPLMVEFAARTLGVPVALGEIRDVDGGPFDVVTMWDYIEHSVDPHDDVEACAVLLRPGGIVALSTGDLESLVARASGRRWHLLTPRHHNFFFSGATIRRLLEAHGFEVLDVSHPGARYSISHLVYKLGRTAPGTLSTRVAGRVANSSVGRATLPINLFDIVTVVGQKRAA
jgi:SAM-dependent methyltransferase